MPEPGQLEHHTSSMKSWPDAKSSQANTLTTQQPANIPTTQQPTESTQVNSQSTQQPTEPTHITSQPALSTTMGFHGKVN